MLPYHFDFVCGVKQRWSGKNIVDIFSEVSMNISMVGLSKKVHNNVQIFYKKKRVICVDFDFVK